MDAGNTLDISTFLNRLQAIFEQTGLADLKITFPYQPAPGSWQEALQQNGLTGFSKWLLADSTDKTGKKASVSMGSPSDGTPPAEKSSLVADIAEAARHVGQVFRTMVLGDSQANQQSTPPADQKQVAPKPAPSSQETLTAFNNRLEKLIQSKDANSPSQPAAKTAPPASPAPKDDPTDWKTWAKQGLDTMNQFLNKGIKEATGQLAKSSKDGASAKTSGDSGDTSEDKTDDKSSAPAKKQGDKADTTSDDDSKSSDPESGSSDSDKASDSDDSSSDSDKASDSDSSSSDSDSSDSESSDDSADSDTSGSSDDADADTSTTSTYDGDRDHLLDVGDL